MPVLYEGIVNILASKDNLSSEEAYSALVKVLHGKDAGLIPDSVSSSALFL
jgi:hypothetical protein